MPSIVIARARREDLDSLAALHFETFPGDTGERWRRRDFAEILRLPDYHCLLARREELACGYALARFAADECELLSLGVATRWQRRGIGARLLDALFEACVRAGVARLFLEVREDNHPARAFYVKHGFAIVGRRTGYYRGRNDKVQDALTMARIFV